MARQEIQRETGMNAGGWLLLACSWGFIIFLNVFCFGKVMTKKEIK